MAIKLFNTLTKEKELFKPIKDGEVKIYTCGPTVYDTAHIGNFRTFIFEDLLKRYFLLKGYKVKHVMNLTDVDDKTIQRSIARKISISKLTQKYIDLFFKDLDTLKIIRADSYPKATEHVDIMIDMIQKLVDYGYAYQSDDGSIYFNIKNFDNYGKLSQINLSELKKSERIASDDYSKDNPQDFVLWKSWKEEDNKVFWDSPWGKGRPGWHIECSAMSTKYLGVHFDIHCGGVDNIFPHHENEIAQAECANDNKFVNYWLHSEHLMVDSGKMSKSLGNFHKIPDLLEMGFIPESLRYILLNGHYRTKLDFSISKKHEASKVVNRVNDFYNRLIEFSIDPTSSQLPDEYNSFISALDDDLNTPKAFGVFFEWLRNTNTKLDNESLSEFEINRAINFVDKFNSVFDLILPKSKIPRQVLDLVKKREEARANKKWDVADTYRDEIKKMGWIIEDTQSGTKLKSCD
jgi:cysteinyl-tRNA synthetase